MPSSENAPWKDKIGGKHKYRVILTFYIDIPADCPEHALAQCADRYVFHPYRPERLRPDYLDVEETLDAEE